jgi:hypothetical protein
MTKAQAARYNDDKPKLSMVLEEEKAGRGRLN